MNSLNGVNTKMDFMPEVAISSVASVENGTAPQEETLLITDKLASNVTENERLK